MPRLSHLFGTLAITIDGQRTEARVAVSHAGGQVHEVAVTLGETPIRSLDQLVIAAVTKALAAPKAEG